MTTPEEILKLDNARRDAMKGADVATLSNLFADDIVWIHASAKVDGKSGLLDTIGSGKTKYLDISCSDETVRFFDNLAIVGGIADMKLNIGGETRDLKNRFTIIWRKNAANWQVVHWQSTTVRTA